MPRLHRPLFLIMVLAALLAAALPAQTVWTVDGNALGAMTPHYLPSPGYPVGAPGFTGPAPLPQAAALPPALFPAGGVAIDETTSRVFTTDGLQIATDHHNLYAPFVPGGLLPPLAPAPILLTGAPLTGMGADPVGNRLFVTDGGSYGACTLGFPFTLLGPAVPFPFGMPPGLRLTGIDYETSTGSLWGVDVAGNIYHWMPFGPAIGPQPVAIAASPLPMTGLAVNECNGPGALAPPFCSTQLLGYHVLVTDGGQIFDALNVANPPIPLATPAFPTAGLAFSADMQYLPGVGLPPIAVGWLGWQKPQNNGIGGANALRLVGAQPLTTALFLYDFCPIPGGLYIPASGETLWLNPFSATFNFAPLVTDAIGQINQPVNLSFSLTGFTYTGQFALYSPLSPLGYALSDAMTFTIGLP
ncbi:MAG: hypothetical protein H6807_01010 [Planctomycetes bacterium]|nr:hypothetical protein [Planctomycetota bacterium]